MLLGCVVILLALITPRFVLFVLWLFTDVLSRAYHSWFWPTLGFFFLPVTTIMYAIAQNSFHGLKGGGIVLFVIGILVDFGLIGGGRRGRRRSGS
jgi:hypothetical protein